MVNSIEIGLATAMMGMAVATSSMAGTCDTGPSNFDIVKVMEAARSPKPNLVLLSAHRGYWRSVPENSTAALREAVARNIETIEIDVRLDNDGNPWLLHDLALDRLTTGSGYLSGTSKAGLAGVRLRDRYGQPTTTQLETLDQALDFLGKNLRRDPDGTVRGFVLVIDLKSPPSSDPNAQKASGYEALKASWARVTVLSAYYAHLWGIRPGLPVLGNAIIFKLKAREVPSREQLERDFNLDGINGFFLHIEPVMHADDGTNGNRVIKDYFRQPYVIGYEPSAEYVGQDNTSRWIDALVSAGRTVPGFASWYDYPEGVAFSTGICCLSRNTDPGVDRPLDYTANWDFALQIGANWLTADAAPFLHYYLKSQGRRDLSQIC
jgi:glycerophosphoryl diester phosphodiesterase